MLQEDNNQYQEVLATLTSTNKDLKRQVDQLRFDLSKASAPSPGNSASRGEEVENLKQEMERLQSEKDEVMEELEGVTEEVVSLRREKQALAKRVEDVNQQIAHLQDQHRSGVAVGLSNHLPDCMLVCLYICSLTGPSIQPTCLYVCVCVHACV